MATGRSFAEYVKDKCFNGLYQAAEDYVNEDWELLNLYAPNVHRIGFEPSDSCLPRSAADKSSHTPPCKCSGYSQV